MAALYDLKQNLSEKREEKTVVDEPYETCRDESKCEQDVHSLMVDRKK